MRVHSPEALQDHRSNPPAEGGAELGSSLVLLLAEGSFLAQGYASSPEGSLYPVTG